ncbi:hypothetical protein BH11VER1_BH11VER1_42190 [soil metagenome]
MTTITTHQAKTHPSRYLAEVEKGGVRHYSRQDSRGHAGAGEEGETKGTSESGGNTGSTLGLP